MGDVEILARSSVPETFVINRDGRIAHKQIGPISPEALEDTFLPLIRRLQQQ